MKENEMALEEVIEFFKRKCEIYEEIFELCRNSEITGLYKVYKSVKALLEELDQYRELGTVEELNKKLKTELPYMSIAQAKFKQELDVYRKLGTVEELREAKERQNAKKPKKSGFTDNKGAFHEINGINGVPYDLCPNCKTNLCTEGYFGRDKRKLKYCENCGQRLDWS